MNIGQMLARQKQVAEYKNLRRIIREMEEAKKALRLARETRAAQEEEQ